MNIGVESFTSPIDPLEIAHIVDKSFASGGGGGSVSENILNPFIKTEGARLLAPIVVPVNTEMDICSFSLNFTGGLYGAMLGFATFDDPSIDATFNLYVNGTKVGHTRIRNGQSVSWGASVAPQPAGPGLCKITAYNNEGYPLNISSANAFVMEFQPIV